MRLTRARLPVTTLIIEGEPHAIKKNHEKDPFFISGTLVSKGVGTMIAIATGINSLNGRTMLALEVEQEDTPLQQKLGVIAGYIAKVALWGAVSLFLGLTILYFIINF